MCMTSDDTNDFIESAFMLWAYPGQAKSPDIYKWDLYCKKMYDKVFNKNLWLNEKNASWYDILMTCSISPISAGGILYSWSWMKLMSVGIAIHGPRCAVCLRCSFPRQLITRLLQSFLHTCGCQLSRFVQIRVFFRYPQSGAYLQ